jgi:hypothetical protein
MYRYLILLLAAGLTACASNGERIDRLAQSAALSRSIVGGSGFLHIAYMKSVPSQSASQPLIVYFDGDGLPWGPSGMEPAADPTTRNPLALKLLIAAARPGAYIARPCYQQLESGCSFELWTSDRYSERVVASMATAVRAVADQARARSIVLVGYSGGGPLAVLVAERIERVAAVVTIAANLDVETWAQHHRYLPLTGSLNPARSERVHPWPELHFFGAKDATVPQATTTGYFQRHAAAQQRVMPSYDHVCCWVENWTTLLENVDEAVRLAQ